MGDRAPDYEASTASVRPPPGLYPQYPVREKIPLVISKIMYEGKITNLINLDVLSPRRSITFARSTDYSP